MEGGSTKNEGTPGAKPEEKGAKKSGKEPTPEEARAQERQKLHGRMEKLEEENRILLEKIEQRDGDISNLLKKQQEKEEELAKAKEAEEAQRQKEEEEKIAKAKEKDEAVAELFNKSEELIKNLNERIDLAEKTGSDRIDALIKERDEAKLASLRLSIINDYENNAEGAKPLIRELVTGSTEEELRASAEESHRKYMNVRQGIIESEGMEPATPNLAAGHTQETMASQVPNEVRKLATSPRFADDKDFNEKMGAFRNRDNKLMAELQEKKKLIFGEFRKRGIE